MTCHNEGKVNGYDTNAGFNQRRSGLVLVRDVR